MTLEQLLISLLDEAAMSYLVQTEWIYDLDVTRQSPKIFRNRQACLQYLWADFEHGAGMKWERLQ